jgi:hypothetical protein
VADELIPEDIAYTPAQAQPSTHAATEATEEAPLVISAPQDNSLPTAENNESPADSAIASAPREPEATSGQSCSQNPGLRKSLTIGSFTRLVPHSANAGNLYDAEQGVAQLFRYHLRTHPILNPELLPLGAADTSNEYQRQSQAQQIARRMGTQFVLQGVIADMSMNDPASTYHPGLYRRAANLFYDMRGNHTNDTRTRQFALNLELRDGYTGESLLAKTYHTSGIWRVKKPVGFDSAAFRDSDYAQQIDKLVMQASQDLAQTIACQPFIVSIDAPPGRTQVLLAGGANNGLHSGDQLDLYQLVVSPSNTEYMLAETRLIKRNARLQLTEVYPSHSTATLMEGEYLNGAFLAVSD